MKKTFSLLLQMRTYRLLILSTLGAFLIGSVCGADDTILSKNYAATIFTMNKNEWNDSIRKGGATQTAAADLNAQGVARMKLQYDNGVLLYVVPEFDGSDIYPSRINVTLAMPTPMSLMFDQAKIDEIKGQAKIEILPEYEVLIDHQSVGGGVALFFIIAEN